MELKEAILTRRSVRRFTEEAVPQNVIEEVVGMAAYAPSWKNTQVTRYIAITDAELKSKVAQEGVLGFGNNAKIIEGAPVLVVVTYKHGISGYERSGEPTTSKGDKWEVFDAGLATQTFSLAAHEKGLGAVIMGIFDDQKVAEIVGVPEGQTVAALVGVGYSAEEPQAPKRKSVEDLLIWK